MFKKKSQAAMEFLMTYGWALLVVLVAIAALVYFGVLNPSSFLPEKCTLMSGLSCNDFVATRVDSDVDNARISIVIQNGIGQNMKNFDIVLEADDLTCVEDDVSKSYFCNVDVTPVSYTYTTALECGLLTGDCTDCTNAVTGDILVDRISTLTNFPDGGDEMLHTFCFDLVSGQRMKADLKFGYLSQHDIPHTRTGEMIVEIE